jgi:hypothetical protein
MAICEDLMIENAIYVSRDDFYLWTDGRLESIIGRYGQVSAEWGGETLTLASVPVDSEVTMLARNQ